MKPNWPIARWCFFVVLVIAVHFLCWLSVWSISAAEPENSKRASPSDVLFNPSRVIQIEIRLDPTDWHALRISHPVVVRTATFRQRTSNYHEQLQPTAAKTPR